MRSTVTTAEDICGALRWEQVRAHWFERQGNHQMAARCTDLARDYQQRLARLGVQVEEVIA